MVAAMDNCGQARSTDCGMCSGTTSACVANVCTAPVCGTAFQIAPGTQVASVNTAGQQAPLLGASKTGQSLLFLQPTASACVGGGSALMIGDEAVAGSPPYVNRNISGLANLVGFSRAEETMTLTADGLTIIGVGTSGRNFLASHRTAVGMTDYTLALEGDFATLNGTIPSPGSLAWPVISADGLAFYYSLSGATDTTLNGTYESVRASTGVPFPAATKMPAEVQAFWSLTGMSSDRMTAFMGLNYGTQLMTRNSLSAPFTAPATSSPPGQAWRVVPIAGCIAIGTSEPGGCANEKISTWTEQ
jgi:hypothetical protein